VTIFSNSTTQLAPANGFGSTPTVCRRTRPRASAETNVSISDIQSNKGPQADRKMAWKRACKQLDKAECIASRHAEQRLSERMDKQAAEAIDKANDLTSRSSRSRSPERKLFPQMLHFRRRIRFSRCEVCRRARKIGGPGRSAPGGRRADMSIQIHESMINNLALDALSGRTVHEEKLQKAVTDMLGHLPEKMKGDEDGKPWAISFARRQPIFVTFADDGFKISLHGARYYKGSDSHPGMNVTATYKIEKSAKGFKAVRQATSRSFPRTSCPGPANRSTPGVR